jgi:hypothetical protein
MVGRVQSVEVLSAEVEMNHLNHWSQMVGRAQSGEVLSAEVEMNQLI